MRNGMEELVMEDGGVIVMVVILPGDDIHKRAFVFLEIERINHESKQDALVRVIT